jgi:hypothetical protein
MARLRQRQSIRCAKRLRPGRAGDALAHLRLADADDQPKPFEIRPRTGANR